LGLHCLLSRGAGPCYTVCALTHGVCAIAHNQCVRSHITSVCDRTWPVCAIAHGQRAASMTKRLYPAVLERGPKGTFGAWFPDFPGCVAAGRSHEETIERAEHALAKAVDILFEHGRPLPEP